MNKGARLFGHPIHPMLIPFPIGLWVFAMVADILFIWRGNPAWQSVAFYCIAGGKPVYDWPQVIGGSIPRKA